MNYFVNFERATALFDSGSEEKLTLSENGVRRGVDTLSGIGYEVEIARFL